MNSARSTDTQIVHSPGKGIFKHGDDDSWSQLQPLAIDNLLPPDLDLTIEDESPPEPVTQVQLVSKFTSMYKKSNFKLSKIHFWF